MCLIDYSSKRVHYDIQVGRYMQALRDNDVTGLPGTSYMQEPSVS